MRERPNKTMILGGLKHRVFDSFNKSEARIVAQIDKNLNDEEILLIYSRGLDRLIQEITSSNFRTFEAFYINFDDFSKEVKSFMTRELELRVKAVKKALGLGFFGRELWINLQPKYLTEFKIESDEIGIKGRIDRVEFGEKIVPYELKTRDKIFESDKIQLAAYALLLESEFSRKVDKGVIETGQDRKEIEINEEFKKKVIEIAEEIRSMDEDLSWKNLRRCKFCRPEYGCYWDEKDL